MSSISESATSTTTSRLRSRRREVPKPPSPCVFLPPALSDVLRSTRAARKAGASPKTMPVDDRHREGEGQHTAVEADRIEPRNVARIERAHDLQRGRRESKPRRAAQEAEQQAFGQQLPEQAAASPRRAPSGPRLPSAVPWRA